MPCKRKRKVYRDKIISQNIFLLFIILFIITKQQETNTQKNRKQHGNCQIHRNYYVTLKKSKEEQQNMENFSGNNTCLKTTYNTKNYSNNKKTYTHIANAY